MGKALQTMGKMVGLWRTRTGGLGAALLLVAVGALGLLPRQAAAQGFTESFDDVSTLAGSGWVLQNNSSPVGSAATWLQGGATLFNAYNGASTAYIQASQDNAAAGGDISNWLITPNRTFRNGDVLTYYTRSATAASDRLEVRLSTNGASTNVGSTAAGVGDFNTLLAAVNPTMVSFGYPTTWTQYTVTLSGLPAPTSGRIGFRYFVNAAQQPTSSTVGIDEVQYTPYVCPTLTLSPATLPNGGWGVAYSQTLSQTGALGTPSYAITTGALPPGVTLSASGTTSGSPTATGNFSFTVTVSDASGCSYSRLYSIIVLVSPPSAPGIVGVVPGDGQATVSWTEPLFEGGGFFYEYSVTAVQDNTKGCAVYYPATSCSVTGLTNGQAYSFNVVANNFYHNSPPATTGTVTPAGTPGAPQGVGASPGDGQARVAWQVPLTNGGSPITGYTVVAVQDASKGCTTTGALLCTVAGLANGSAYSFRVTASNAQGAGTPSAASTTVMLPVPDAGGGAPPAPEPVVLAPGASGSLAAPTSATLGSGSTLTVQPSAAGGSIVPPAQGSATVQLGSTGGSLTVAQSGGGQASVLRAGNGTPVLGLGNNTTGSLQVASRQPDQVLLDVGPAGPGASASGRQVVAGLGGARIEAQRQADGSLVVRVLEGSAVVQCAPPCSNSNNNGQGSVSLLVGEQARISPQGLVQQVTLQTSTLPTPLPNGLQLLGTPGGAFALDGPAPARTPGSSLLAQAGAALRSLLGLPLASSGQSSLGTVLFTLPDGTTLGLLPLAAPVVDLSVPNGASIAPDGTLRIAHQGVVQTFGPAPLDLGAALQALQALLPGARLSIGSAGTWRIDVPGGTALSLRPGWVASAGTPQGGTPRIEPTGPGGQPMLVQPNGLRTPLQPALAEPAALLALLRSADAQAQWQMGLDGRVRLVLAGSAYLLQPQAELAQVPAGGSGTGTGSVWLEQSPGGSVLLRVRLADGRVQTVVVAGP